MLGWLAKSHGFLSPRTIHGGDPRALLGVAKLLIFYSGLQALLVLRRTVVGLSLPVGVKNSSAEPPPVRAASVVAKSGLDSVCTAWAVPGKARWAE